MNKEEIKEILDKLKLLCYDDYCLEFVADYIERKEEKILLDYITNLQQENEKLKEHLQNKGIIKTCENCEWFGICPLSYREYDYKSRCEKAINSIDILQEIIYQQPTYNKVEDKWLLDKLNGFKNILNGSDEK